MKKLKYCFIGLGTLFAWSLNSLAHAQQQGNPQPGNSQVNYGVAGSNTAQGANYRIGIVNTKKCLEQSKLGKQEQANFEKMKQQMEQVLQDKERILEELESKLNDDDYMDSISDEAASELKRKKRTIRSEGMQLQNQYMQTLQQANMKIIQHLTESIAKASEQVAKDPSMGQPISVIFTDEACTFFTPSLDVSDRIIARMNATFEAEQKDNASKPR